MPLAGEAIKDKDANSGKAVNCVDIWLSDVQIYEVAGESGKNSQLLRIKAESDA